jgi:hypothetical protein
MIKWSEAEVIVDQVLAQKRGSLHLAGIEIPRPICNALKESGLLIENEENVIKRPVTYGKP